MTRNAHTCPQLQLVQSYTILLSSLPMVTLLIESLCWTIVVPLPTIMELDGLALNANPPGDAAKARPFVGVIICLVVLHLPLHWCKGGASVELGI